MSLVVEASPSSPATDTSTSDFSDFVLPSSPESPPLHLFNRFSSATTNYSRSLSLAGFSPRTPVKRSSCDKEFHHSIGNRSGDFDELSTPIKKAAKRLAELDPFTVFDSNSRDSGFDSEGSRLSYSLSTTSINSVGSNPGTPASLSSGISSAHSSSNICHDDHDSQSPSEKLKSAHYCHWENCTDPDLSTEDDQRKDLLSHVLSRHVQPLEIDNEQLNGKSELSMFKCLWKGCKVFGKGSKLYSWLESHVIERHAGPKPYLCPLPGCLLRFSTKLLAERHINSHFTADDESKGKTKNMTPSNSVSKSTPPPSFAFKEEQQRQRLSKTTARFPVKRKERRAPSCDNQYRKTKKSRCDDDALATKKAPKAEKLTTSNNRRNKVTDTLKSSKRNNGFLYHRKLRESTLASRLATLSCERAEANRISIKKSSSSLNSADINVKTPLISESPAGTNSSTTTTAGISNGGTVRRKNGRIKHVPEDAFDTMHARTMHVLAARCVLSSMKKRTAENWSTSTTTTTTTSKKNSCQKCSGIFSNTDTLTSPRNSRRLKTTSNRHCVCSNFITFRAKILAKRTCGKDSSTESGSSQKSCSQIFCSWIPFGLLPPKWIDEAAFKPIIHLPRSYFPLLNSEPATDHAKKESTSITAHYDNKHSKRNGLCSLSFSK